MPERLKEIFDTSCTKIEDRYSKIAECMYEGQSLRDAETYEIFPISTPVQDAEGLARMLETPNGVDPTTGTYLAQAFMEATKRGISTQRIAMVSDSVIHDIGQSRVDNYNSKDPVKPRTYLGYTVGQASLFRDAKAPDGTRLFGVFSTPEPDAAHADIFVVIKPDKGLKLAIQRVFHDAFKIAAKVPPATS